MVFLYDSCLCVCLCVLRLRAMFVLHGVMFYGSCFVLCLMLVFVCSVVVV